MTEPKDIRKREALIKIHSTQKVGADKDAIDLLTTGSFSRRTSKNINPAANTPERLVASAKPR